MQEILAAGVNGKRDLLLATLGEKDAINYAQQRAQRFLEEAKAEVRAIPCRDPQLVENLLSLADFGLARRA
jgi:geranylgeranyl pyrophosphate synthase